MERNWPKIRNAGFDGYLISFAERLTDPSNRAALAFHDAIKQAKWDGVLESSTSLISTYLRFDPFEKSHEDMRKALEELISDRDWYSTQLPSARTLWRIPTAFGGNAGPQLDEAASAAGFSVSAAVESVVQKQLRVQTIGFAPGMPYLGELEPSWNIPRQTELTEKVPAGGLCVAIRQLVLFPVATPTGWRHIGQTNFRLFQPENENAFMLRPGDEVLFQSVTLETLKTFQNDPLGGATSEEIC